LVQWQGGCQRCGAAGTTTVAARACSPVDDIDLGASEKGAESLI